MDTPKTISSSSTRTVPSKIGETIIISDSTNSRSHVRMPVSWKSTNRSLERTESNVTLNNIQKVSNWINSLHGNQKTEKDEYLKRRSKVQDKSSVFVRCDFNKSIHSKKIDNSDGIYNYCAPLYKYLENAMCEKVGHSTNELKKRTTSSDESCQGGVRNEKSDCSSGYEMPLSPESQKKELCSYLKLMNPADKKQILVLQNRRSTRVKNLSLMQEKKELEKKLKCSSPDSFNLNEEVEKYVGLKSFKDLNIQIDKDRYAWLDVNSKHDTEEVQKDSYQFPKPSQKLLDHSDDFDNVMQTKIKLYKRNTEHKLNGTMKAKLRSDKKRWKNKENVTRDSVGKFKTIRSTKISDKVNNNVKRILTTRKLTRRTRSIQQLQSPVRIFRLRLRSGNRIKGYPLRKNKLKIKLLQQGKLKKMKRKTKDILHEETEKINKEAKEQDEKIPNCDSDTPRPKSMPSLPYCEVITVNSTAEGETDIKNLMDDMIDFDSLSEEHRKCLIETRILCSKNVSFRSTRSSLSQLPPLYGFSKSEVDKFRKIYESKFPLFKNDEPLLKVDCPEGKQEAQSKTEEKVVIKNSCQVLFKFDENSEQIVSEDIPVPLKDLNIEPENNVPNRNKSPDRDAKRNNANNIPLPQTPVKLPLIPFNKQNEVKSLHRSLNFIKRKALANSVEFNSSPQGWVPLSPPQKQKKNQHSIFIDRENGPVLKAFYVEFNLVVCQEYMVSFWTQTALGNVLGAQNMWIPKGSIQRLVLNNKCVQKESLEMVVSSESNVAYIELWTKEHKSDIRQRPVADVFVTIYFWKQRQNGLDKKVLQLENINGFADDVQYSVFKYAPKIIVSWHSATNEMESKQTFIHCYHLAADYQTVANISQIEPVSHYVSSLHNIEDCESLIMGCGENKITLWNLEYGYIVATIELTDIKSPLCTLCVRCDRGFLFTIQQCLDKELRLIAINGHNHTWKKLASYIPPDGYNRLKGACIENGIIVSLYDQGILCWNARTGEPIIEETQSETEYIPSGKYIIMIANDQVNVKHAIAHLISPEET